MRCDVKICGITTADALDAAIDAGADAVGLVFADSPRRIDARTAEMLLGRIRGPMRAIAVIEAPDQLPELPFHAVQLPEGVQHAFRIPVLRAFHDDDTVLARLESASAGGEGDPWAHGFVLDGSRGCGRPFDRERARMAARRGGMILAGGLSPDTVGAIVRAIEPRAVDASSSLESSPGRKDPARIARFVAEVHAAEAELAGVGGVR
jgi:phosphoribosylanthranilate isomerase